MEWNQCMYILQNILWSLVESSGAALSGKLSGLSGGIPNCFTLSNPTQIATFEAIPLSGINCQLLANGIQIHFHSAPNSFPLGPKSIFFRPQIDSLCPINYVFFQNASSTAHFKASHGEVRKPWCYDAGEC